MNLEEIGWITRAVLALICVVTICWLAIMEKKIDPVLSALVSSLLTAFVLKGGTTPPTTPFGPEK